MERGRRVREGMTMKNAFKDALLFMVLSLALLPMAATAMPGIGVVPTARAWAVEEPASGAVYEAPRSPDWMEVCVLQAPVYTYPGSQRPVSPTCSTPDPLYHSNSEGPSPSCDDRHGGFVKASP